MTQYPKKGFGSYILPFLLIILLAFSGWYIVKNEINLEQIKKVLQAPEIAKDERVKLSFIEAQILHKPWNADQWTAADQDTYLQAGDSLKTGSAAFAVLEFFDKSEVRIDQNTQMKLVRMDKDEALGHQIAVELVQGQAWVRYPHSSTEDSEFIFSSEHQIIQLGAATIMNVKSGPDTTSVLGGNIDINIVDERNGSRKPGGRVSIAAGEEIILDDLNRDSIKAGEENIVDFINQEKLSSAWFERNLSTEAQKESIVEIIGSDSLKVSSEGLEDWSGGDISITSPEEGSNTGAWVLVKGTLDDSSVESIEVNGVEATLGLNDDWEARVRLSKSSNSILVTAQKKGEKTIYKADELKVIVDDVAPGIGDITNPDVDENNEGSTGDRLELKGLVSADANSICVIHNGGEPYCLKQFKLGDTEYRYVAGVGFGNIVRGKNSYTIQAKDSFGNVASKTVTLYYGERTEESSPSSQAEESPDEPTTTVEPGKPSISSPDPSTTFETSETSVTLSGNIGSNTQTLLINGKSAQFNSDGSYTAKINIERGESLIKVQGVARNGEKSKTATLRVLSLEADEEEGDTAEITE